MSVYHFLFEMINEFENLGKGGSTLGRQNLKVGCQRANWNLNILQALLLLITVDEQAFRTTVKMWC